MTKLQNMEVRRVDDGVIMVQQEFKDEIGCYLSKSTDDGIEGRYLHALAGAVLESQPKAVKLAKMVAAYLLALDQWENSDKAERRVKSAERDMRQAVDAFKDLLSQEAS